MYKNAHVGQQDSCKKMNGIRLQKKNVPSRAMFPTRSFPTMHKTYVISTFTKKKSFALNGSGFALTRRSCKGQNSSTDRLIRKDCKKVGKISDVVFKLGLSQIREEEIRKLVFLWEVLSRRKKKLFFVSAKIATFFSPKFGHLIFVGNSVTSHKSSEHQKIWVTQAAFTAKFHATASEF